MNMTLILLFFFLWQNRKMKIFLQFSIFLPIFSNMIQHLFCLSRGGGGGHNVKLNKYDSNFSICVKTE